MVPSSEVSIVVVVSIYCFETALKNLGKWRQKEAPVSHLPTNILQKF